MRKRVQIATVHDLPDREFREVIRQIREMNEGEMLLIEVLEEIAREMDSAPLPTDQPEEEAPAAAA